MTEISIIVRTRDRELLLSRALNSIINQTFENWKIIIINNGGDKKTVERVIKRYKAQLCGRYTVYHTDKPYKMEVATNIGIKLSNSKYIAILDDDDTWYPKFLEECIQYLELNKNFSGVVTQTTIVKEMIENNNIKEINVDCFNKNLKEVNYFSLLKKNLYTTNAFVYLRSVIDDIGNYNEDYPVLGDWDFNIRFAKEKKIGVITKSLAFYHKRVLISKKDGLYQNSAIRTHIHYDYYIRKKYLFEAFKKKNIYLFNFILINLVVRQCKLRIKLLMLRWLRFN